MRDFPSRFPTHCLCGSKLSASLLQVPLDRRRVVYRAPQDASGEDVIIGLTIFHAAAIVPHFRENSFGSGFVDSAL